MAAVVYSGDLELLSSDILALRCGRCCIVLEDGEVAGACAVSFFFVYRSNGEPWYGSSFGVAIIYDQEYCLLELLVARLIDVQSLQLYKILATYA
jgi:hypothetical protein